MWETQENHDLVNTKGLGILFQFQENDKRPMNRTSQP